MIRAVRFACVAAFCAFSASVAARVETPWNAGYFPNVELTTQAGERVRFRDLIKGRTVAIELMYTTCRYACPLETARLAQVQALLGERMGKDVFFLSISIDPEHDTPAVLKAFAAQFHAGPGWIFLTGKRADIDLLGKKIGLYTRADPENKDGHVPALLIGNEPSGQWMRGSALDHPKMTATLITRWVAGYPAAAPGASYADARPIGARTRGEYLFGSKCRVCHTIDGQGGLGPDLSAITRTRDRGWLARYIADPDAVLAAGDPIARSLSARFRGVRMPNLQLSDEQIRDVLDYLELRSTRPRH